MLKYKFEKIYHSPVNSFYNVINIEEPYNVLFELDLLNTSDSASSFLKIVENCIETENSSEQGFEQIALFIGPEITSIEYYDDNNEIVSLELPTIELLKLLHDWRDFLIEQERNIE